MRPHLISAGYLPEIGQSCFSVQLVSFLANHPEANSDKQDLGRTAIARRGAATDLLRQQCFSEVL
jgi:hypothetical protein